MNRWLSSIIFLALLTPPALAQTLIPATSEDINEFDRQVSAQLKRSSEKKSKGNFGSEVSEEAKKLKDSDGDQDKNFGKWVSGQRKKSEQGRPSAEGGIGSGKRGSSSDKSGDHHGNGKNKKK